MFATRSPARPNAIGLSIVRLLAIRDATLEIADLDILDRTLLLDISPMCPRSMTGVTLGSAGSPGGPIWLAQPGRTAASGRPRRRWPVPGPQPTRRRRVPGERRTRRMQMARCQL
ncbi:MAG: TrmO family methyltransferase [Chloroflexota bacterium]